MNLPQVRILEDGKRLYLSHGPIDLIIEAFGSSEEIRFAYDQASRFFSGVLQGLVKELSLLKTPVNEQAKKPKGLIAQSMMNAVEPYCDTFVTPMAAVAGSVADAVLTALISNRNLTRAYVNNGGDIALYLKEGQYFQAGMVFEINNPAINGTVKVPYCIPVRGIATSGWRGNSHSMGIADSVTVFADSAAQADVAATMIGNTVNINHPNISRIPASAVKHDADLGQRLVTLNVGDLDDHSIKEALDKGTKFAKTIEKRGLIKAATLTLKGNTETIGIRKVAEKKETYELS